MKDDAGFKTLAEFRAELDDQTMWTKVRYGPIRAWNRWGWHWRELHWAWQRVRRGYSNLDMWNADNWLAKTFGTMLVQMADIAHGWPERDGLTFEEWVSQMRTAGEALLTYARMDITDDDYRATYEQKTTDARKALEWVGANLPALWD